MIQISAVLPHSPLLHPGIGADVKHSLEDILKAVKRIEDDIYAAQPETVVLLSDQPIGYDSHLLINVHDPIRFDLSEFGDFGMSHKLTPDLQLIDQLQRSLRNQGHSVTLDTQDALNFASAVPLSFILKKNPNIQVVPIAPSQAMDAKELYETGRAMQDILMQSSKRIALIVAGDGSHALNKKSPNDPTKEGTQFDEYLQHILANRNASSLLNLDPKLVDNASQAIYNQLCVFFGALHGVQTRSVFSSYSAPFGVGYFAASYQ